MIFVTYYTVLIVSGFRKEELNYWWHTSGKYNILLQMVLIAVACMCFWESMYMPIWHKVSFTLFPPPIHIVISYIIFMGILFVIAFWINASVVAARRRG